MKYIAALAVAFITLARPAAAQPVPPITRTINGNPLTIVVGGDTSMQVYNADDGGRPQFFPTNCSAGETGDYGVFFSYPTGSSLQQLNGPDFQNHPCGSRAQNVYTDINYVPWFQQSISQVTGTGTAADPYTVVIDVSGNFGLVETVTYVSGSSTVNIGLSWGPPAQAPGGNPLTFWTYVGGDLNVPVQDFGYSFGSADSAGSFGSDSACAQLPYRISLLGSTPADRYASYAHDPVWAEIAGRTLSDTVSTGCQLAPGAALEWIRDYPGTPVLISTGVSFILPACPLITLSPSSLPNATLGQPYNQTISASGGTAPYTYSFSGTLPPGLALSSSGVISGTPTQNGTYFFSVTATDSAGCTGTRNYSIGVGCNTISISPATLPDGAVDEPYGPVLIRAPAGNPPLTFSTSEGTLPPGLVLIPNASSSAQIVGTPTTSGDYSFTISVRDSGGCVGSRPYTVSIVSSCSAPGAPRSPAISPAGNPNGPVTGIDYLDLSWLPPAEGSPPTSYIWQINGREPVPVAGPPVHGVEPQALVVEGYNNDPIQLTVFAIACGTPGIAGPPAESQSYDPAPPQAAFETSISGQTVTVTDNSSPQATSWLWLWGDGEFSTEQAPGPHTYPTANVYTIALIATNGAGSNETSKTVELSVTASASRVRASRNVTRAFDVSNPVRQRLETVRLTGRGEKWLVLAGSGGPLESIAYLRFVDESGKTLVERRLSVAPGQTEASFNIEAFRLNGTYTLELVSHDNVVATLVETGIQRVEPPSGPRRIER